MRLALVILVTLSGLGCGPEKPHAPSGKNAFYVSASAGSGQSGGAPSDLESVSKALGILVFDGTFSADVMALQAPPRAQELAARFKAGVAKHPDWWLDYAKQPAPGETLRYHPNMGISEAEYDEMLGFMGNLTMGKVGEATVVFVDEGMQKVSLHSVELSQQLEGISIDFGKGVVSTPYGDLPARDPIVNSDPEAPTGPWAGPCWEIQEQLGDGPFGTAVEFSLGRRLNDGRGVLYYKVLRVLPDAPPDKIDVFLLYDPPDSDPESGSTAGSAGR